MPVADLNAADIVNHQQMLFTKDALTSFLDRRGRRSAERDGVGVDPRELVRF